MDASRGRFNMSSTNISKKSSANSSVSSIFYIERIGIQSNDPTWVGQIEAEIFSLLYVSTKREETSIHNGADSSTNMPLSSVEYALNLNTNVD